MANVSRDNPSEKLLGLVNEAPVFFIEMEHLSYLKTLKVNFTAGRLSAL